MVNIITDENDIAIKLNTFFTNVGPSLNEPSAHEFTFNQITEVDVLHIIDKLLKAGK